jgi:uncharacterized membrane protein
MANKPNPKPQIPITPHPEQRIITQTYQGPIPDPLTLQKFEQILPGLAERIVFMAEAVIPVPGSRLSLG